MNAPPDETQTVTTDQKPSTNGNGTPGAPQPQSASPDSENTGQAAPPGPDQLRFEQPEYSAIGSADVTVLRTGDLTGEARVKVRAKKSTELNGDYLMLKELLFEDQQATERVSVPVGINMSPTPTTFILELLSPSAAELGNPSRAVIVVPSATFQARFKSLPARVSGFFARPDVSRVLKHALLAAFLIGSVILGNLLVKDYANAESRDWHDHLAPRVEPELKFNLDGGAYYWIPPQAQARLQDQLTQIRHKKAYHLALMEFFYKGYYMGIVILSFTAALAAITLLLISKKGWSETSQYIITTFFIMTCATLFYGSWAGLFKQEDNITENKVLFLKYASLENELFSYVTTGQALNYRVTTDDLRANPAATAATPETAANANKAKAKTPKEEPAQPAAPTQTKMNLGIDLNTHDFIHYIDLQLAQDNIAIGFDYSQVPNYKNAFSTLTK